MPLFPPLCMKVYYNGVNNPSTNVYTSTLTVTPQTYATGQYDGTTIAPGMYTTNNFDGFIYLITAVSNVTPTSVDITLSDIDGKNASIDPSQFAGGGPLVNSDGYIFELNPLTGLPALTSINNPPSITFPDSILGRFIYDQTSGGGGLYKTNFSANFTTPDENDILNLSAVGLKNLAYTPGESVLVSARLYDAPTYNATSGTTVYTGGGAGASPPGTYTLVAGGAGPTSQTTQSYIFNAGSSASFYQLAYIGGNAFSSVGQLISAGGAGASPPGTYTLVAGGAGPTSQTTQSYTTLIGGNAFSSFGQLISGGTANTIYTNLETQLEGIVKYYDASSGTITIEQLTNIHGLFGGTVDYTMNLTGKRGTSIFSNYGPPIQKIGRFGDTYIDRTTKLFYTKQPAWIEI